MLCETLHLAVRAAVRRAAGTPANPTTALLESLGGGATRSGPIVSETRAWNLSYVYCAVSAYGRAFKLMPWHVYQRTADGGREMATGHPVYRLLHQRPNPEMTPSFFKAYVDACKRLWGNGYAEIERDRLGRPIALWPIHPSYVLAERLSDGRLVYRIRTATRPEVTIEQADMFHVRGVSRDGVTGLSVLGAAREAMGFALAVEEYGQDFFGKGITMAGILKRPVGVAPLDDKAIDNLRRSFAAHHSGDNRWLPAILQEGTEWEGVGMPNRDAQFLEIRRFQPEEFARWFDMQPHKLHDLARSTFSNIDAQQIAWVTDSVAPESMDMADEANLKLLTDAEQAEYYTEFDLRGAMRGDHKMRAEFHKILWGIGAETPNEIRRAENLNPIGPAGDRHFVQTSYTTLEALDETQKQENAKTQKQDGAGGDTESAEDLAFRRAVILAYLADRTTNDAMFNLTEIRTLMQQVGLPIQPGYEEPWMPGRDDTGALVSGGTIIDEQGDVVGGEPLESKKQKAKNKNEEGGDADDAEAAVDGDDTEGDEEEQPKDRLESRSHSPQPTGRHGDSTAATHSPQSTASLMPVVCEVVGRLVRKESRAMERLQKRARIKSSDTDDTPDAEAVAAFYRGFRAEVAESLAAPAASLARVLGKNPAEAVAVAQAWADRWGDRRARALSAAVPGPAAVIASWAAEVPATAAIFCDEIAGETQKR